MSSDSSEAAAGATIAELATRLDELSREVRRQGRAAVAAQAAAESCLERLEAGPVAAAPEPQDEAKGGDVASAAWVRAVLPVADALDRVLAQAVTLAQRSAEAPAARWPASWFRRAPREAVSNRDLDALAQGLRVLRDQLASALESRGVEADRRLGVPIDPEVHRVIEVRAPRESEPEGTVVEVVRPGYVVAGKVVREAEVVVAAARGARGRG